MRALVVTKKGVSVQDFPVPAKLADTDVLVKVSAVALNPTDWKSAALERARPPGTVVGCDFAGTVVCAGPAVPASRALGMRVAGFTMGGTHADGGAFAEYACAISDAEAAAMGCAFWTAALGLYARAHLALAYPPAQAEGEQWVYVHGGSCDGRRPLRVQLAALSGYRVVATASPHNHELVRGFGADAVFDHRDPDVIALVKAAAGDAIALAYDTIGDARAQATCVAVVRPTGGKVLHILPVDCEAADRAEVEHDYLLLYTALGRDWTWGDKAWSAVPEDREEMARFLEVLPELVGEGGIRPLPVKMWEGGLDAIPDGLDYLKEGKASGEKVVFRI
ncbi:GroES-like protein [Epithele typhae]|uniref:GroES-like protein n=1 Tax=Epithele typhae TaxID=378194 RepID=UPI002007D08D|nr:GroES-like protein [Epithele typhae]KAH9931719.1 GroES-like protein [Epithele typhae]